MATIIKDGTGSGHTVKINDENRMFVNSVEISDDVDAALKGKAFTVNSDSITLTTANESAVFYFKNDEIEDVIITGIFNTFDTSTGGSGGANIKIVRNPTAGTIVSEANPISPRNRNFGSNDTIVSDSFQGGEGKTLTGGEIIFDFPLTIPSTRATLAVFILPRGSSLGVLLTPPSGNTSMASMTGINLHLDGFND